MRRYTSHYKNVTGWKLFFYFVVTVPARLAFRGETFTLLQAFLVCTTGAWFKFFILHFF
jgi:hypothetical protein